MNPNALRPYLGYGPISIAENSGRSQYHGLQIAVERRVSNGLHAGVGYTCVAHARQLVEPDRRPAERVRRQRILGHLRPDRPHVLIVNYIYELPFWRGSGSGWTKCTRQLGCVGRLPIPVRLALLGAKQR